MIVASAAIGVPSQTRTSDVHGKSLIAKGAPHNMAIEFTCPHCKKRLEAPDTMAGKSAECPSCKKKVDVPSKEAT